MGGSAGAPNPAIGAGGMLPAFQAPAAGRFQAARQPIYAAAQPTEDGECEGGVQLPAELCAACVDASCCGPSQACEGDPDCRALLDCVTHCDGTPTCQQDCIDQHPEGFPGLEALGNCIDDSNCTDVCSVEVASTPADEPRQSSLPASLPAASRLDASDEPVMSLEQSLRLYSESAARTAR
ncbi:MAG: hypothetical protein EOO75_10825 [Myxococcales bacterium]|nr:MAG: hypothetical protein EOO75_10825 [Myxococcales bacterium]